MQTLDSQTQPTQPLLHSIHMCITVSPGVTVINALDSITAIHISGATESHYTVLIRSAQRTLTYIPQKDLQLTYCCLQHKTKCLQ